MFSKSNSQLLSLLNAACDILMNTNFMLPHQLLIYYKAVYIVQYCCMPALS